MVEENKPVREHIAKRTFSARREIVFKAWTDPKYVALWWGPHGFTNPVCDLDVRPGGSIRIDMRSPDGTIYPMTGVFREIAAPDRLVFSTTPLDAKGEPLFEILNTVTFVQDGDKTLVTVHALVVKTTAAAEPYLEGMEEGWSQTLDRLAEFLKESLA